MNETDLTIDSKQLTGWRKHKFIVLVGLTIIGALGLVVLSLYLYNSSGAAQLDLSRPGYKSVRDKANRSDTINSFPSSGAITEDTLRDFDAQYSEQLKQVTQFDGFGGDVMSDEALSLDANDTAPIPN